MAFRMRRLFGTFDKRAWIPIILKRALHNVVLKLLKTFLSDARSLRFRVGLGASPRASEWFDRSGNDRKRPDNRARGSFYRRRTMAGKWSNRTRVTHGALRRTHKSLLGAKVVCRAQLSPRLISRKFKFSFSNFTCNKDLKEMSYRLRILKQISKFFSSLLHVIHRNILQL